MFHLDSQKPHLRGFAHVIMSQIRTNQKPREYEIVVTRTSSPPAAR